MKIVLASVNSKYVHQNPAPYYLKAASGREEIILLECNVNQPPAAVLERVMSHAPDVVALGCYIYNAGFVHRLTESIKALFPGTAVVLGGPEVSFDADAMAWGADYLIQGEGEGPFSALMDLLADGRGSLKDIPGLVWRGKTESGEIRQNPVANVHTDPSNPWKGELLEAARGRVVYYEASRGCPFSCAYCLSGGQAVRFFDLERVKADLSALMASGAVQIKFVDRTFNCNRRRAAEIVSFLLEKGRDTGVNFHFEAAADLFDPTLLTLFASAPAGMFDLEIGLQSFHGPTLEACRRKTDLEACCRSVRALRAGNNVHLHLDLIAGLPYEGLEAFGRSLDQALALNPHLFQLGFLKVLRGSELRRRARELGLRFEPSPPYEILSTPWLSFPELCRLKKIEALLDWYYNSGAFSRALRAVFAACSGPFVALSLLAEEAEKAGFFAAPPSLDSRTALLASFCREHGVPEGETLLILDYFSHSSCPSPPKSLPREKGGFSRREGEALVRYEPVGGRMLRFDYGKAHPTDGSYPFREAFPEELAGKNGGRS